jgi:Copper type II ascorbate-dependent monooxygenase, C-terminal domain
VMKPRPSFWLCVLGWLAACGDVPGGTTIASPGLPATPTTQAGSTPQSAAQPNIANTSPTASTSATTPVQPTQVAAISGSAGSASSTTTNTMTTTTTTITSPGTANTAGTAAAMTQPLTTSGSSTPTTSAADPPGTVSITSDAFLLKAGQEIYKCQNFDNPFGGKDTAINRIVSDMTEGSHHLHLYHLTEGTSRTLEDCTSSDFHPLTYTASAPHSMFSYPEGMATRLLGKQGLRVQLHYINTSENDRMASATIKLSPTDASSVQKWVSELYFNQLNINVPPGANQTITTSCTIPNTYGPIGLIAGFTHMHKRGVHFVAKTGDGTMLADVNTWDEPPTIIYDTPIMLMPGDKIEWTCTYNNDTGHALMFGDSAETNEMCIYLARFFSAPDDAQLECMATSPTGTARAVTM